MVSGVYSFGGQVHKQINLSKKITYFVSVSSKYISVRTQPKQQKVLLSTGNFQQNIEVQSVIKTYLQCYKVKNCTFFCQRTELKRESRLKWTLKRSPSETTRKAALTHCYKVHIPLLNSATRPTILRAANRALVSTHRMLNELVYTKITRQL